MTEYLVITGGTLIDGSGGPPIRDGVVVIEGPRIAAIGDAATPVPPQAARMDATGRFVMPGLMNAAVHLAGDTLPLNLIRYEGRYEELALEAAQLALKSGVTTVFDTWGPRDFLIKARDAIHSGRKVGSRIFLAGNIIGYGGPYSDDFYPDLKTGLHGYADDVNALWEQGVGSELLWMTPAELRSAIRRYAESGVDFLRYAMNPLNPEHRPHTVFSPRMQRIIVEEGHRAGITVQSGGSSVEGKHLAMDAGVDLIARPEITGPAQVLPPDTVDMIVQRQMPCAIYAIPDEGQAWMSSKSRWMKLADRNLRALIGAGAKVLMLTDGGVLSANTRAVNTAMYAPPPPLEALLYDIDAGHFNWLLAAEQKGMKPMEVLLAATRHVAEAYQLDKDLGTLAAGKMADILILEKDPLQSAANYRSIAEVIKEGRVVDRSALPSPRVLTAS